MLVGAGIVLALVMTSVLEPMALVIALTVGYMIYMGRGMVIQAQRFRPVEPLGVWRVTLVANLILVVIGMGTFAWYVLGAGTKAWVPFLIFMAGMMALRQWRRAQTARLYAWRAPALRLLQQGDYRKLIRELEDEAQAGRGHPDKLAMVALAYIEQNKFDYAEKLLKQAKTLAPDYASVNGAFGSLRRHQVRYAEAVEVIQRGLAFEENPNSRYYLGLCQFLAGEHDAAGDTLQAVIDDPTLLRQGQLYGAYILGQLAQESGDGAASRMWYDRMAELAPRTIPTLQEESRRHKQTAYGDTLKAHIRDMEHIIARRPLDRIPDASIKGQAD